MMPSLLRGMTTHTYAYINTLKVYEKDRERLRDEESAEKSNSWDLSLSWLTTEFTKLLHNSVSWFPLMTPKDY